MEIEGSVMLEQCETGQSDPKPLVAVMLSALVISEVS